MDDSQLVCGVQPPRRLLENFRNLGHGKRAASREGLAERFAFEVLHGDVGRAIIGLAGFVNGDNVRVMNAARGCRLIYVEAALRRHGEVNSPLRRSASGSRGHPAACGSGL